MSDNFTAFLLRARSIKSRRRVPNSSLETAPVGFGLGADGHYHERVPNPLVESPPSTPAGAWPQFAQVLGTAYTTLVRERQHWPQGSELLDSVQHRDPFPCWQTAKLDFRIRMEDDPPHTAIITLLL